MLWHVDTVASSDFEDSQSRASPIDWLNLRPPERRFNNHHPPPVARPRRLPVPHAAIAPSLVEILRALPATELARTTERLGLKTDPRMRLDAPSQVARLLVSAPELRDLHRLPPPTVELLHRIAEKGGLLTVAAIPPAAEPLLQRSLLFVRGRKGAFELVFPAAPLLTLKPWDGEDPRSLRALLATTTAEAQLSIASHYLGRPATPPHTIALEAAWEALGDPARLRKEIEALAPTERRVLEAVEAEGGEVYTEELLELEREPMRLRSASGSMPSRRGTGFALERRGFLIPLHPNRHVVPTEVSRIVSARTNAEREVARAQVVGLLAGEDFAPRRARFSFDPAPLTMALVLAGRESGADVKPGIGTPKSLITKLSTRFGRDPQAVALLLSLSRAIGLWDPHAGNLAAPPGSEAMDALPGLLFRAWQRGGAWDEARPESEMLRLAEGARDASVVEKIRALLLETLVDLAEPSAVGAGKAKHDDAPATAAWIPWRSLAAYLERDARMPGLARALRRWAGRVGLPPPSPLDIIHRIVVESLPALGIIDLGDEPVGDAEPGAAGDLVLRLTARGRALLATGKVDAPVAPAKSLRNDATPVASKFVDSQVLRIGRSARISNIFAVAPFVDIGRTEDALDLLLAPATLARALSTGIEADALRVRIEALAPLPDAVSRTLAQASVVLGRCEVVPASGFLWVDDASVRELLATRKSTQDLFVNPSPPGGLLIGATIDIDKLVRRCRAVGVEIIHEGQVLRATTTSGFTPIVRTTPAAGMPRMTPAAGTVRARK